MTLTVAQVERRSNKDRRVTAREIAIKGVLINVIMFAAGFALASYLGFGGK